MHDDRLWCVCFPTDLFCFIVAVYVVAVRMASMHKANARWQLDITADSFVATRCTCEADIDGVRCDR